MYTYSKSGKVYYRSAMCHKFTSSGQAGSFLSSYRRLTDVFS